VTELLDRRCHDALEPTCSLAPARCLLPFTKENPTMKRLLLVLGMIGALASNAAAQTPLYGWTLSNSTTDPFDNSGAVSGQPINAYLWYACNGPEGISAAEFDLAFSEGSGTVSSFTPLNAWLNAGTATHLLLADDCESAPILAGRIELEFGTSGSSLCIVPDSTDGNNVSVDCSWTANLWPNQTVGLTTGSAPPCDDRVSGTLCTRPVAVEPDTWGKVKSAYR
jgi:hypothetical protein